MILQQMIPIIVPMDMGPSGPITENDIKHLWAAFIIITIIFVLTGVTRMVEYFYDWHKSKYCPGNFFEYITFDCDSAFRGMYNICYIILLGLMAFLFLTCFVSSLL